jgi:hypothetical protein
MKNPLVLMLWKKAGEPIFLEIKKDTKKKVRSVYTSGNTSRNI